MTSNTSVYIEQLKNHVGQEVILNGWLYRGRSSGKVLFLIVRDGTGLCQCIVEKNNVPDELFEQLKHLGQESSLTVTGTVRAEERSVGRWNEPMVLAGLADAYRAMGRLADARAAAEAGVDAGRRGGLRPGECRAQIALARALIAEGAINTDALETSLSRAEALVDETNARAYLPFIAEARAELARAHGDAAGAARALARAHRLFTEMGARGHAERLAHDMRETS